VDSVRAYRSLYDAVPFPYRPNPHPSADDEDPRLESQFDQYEPDHARERNEREAGKASDASLACSWPIFVHGVIVQEFVQDIQSSAGGDRL
jgi:hypothetical protein